jgi:glycosyltransferase involved in cell wall biosynthesis
MSARPRFLLTFLAWSSGLSGGDRHVLEVAARWREHVDIAVLAPPQALPMLRSFLGDVPAHPLGVAGPRIGAGPLLALEYIRRALASAVRKLPRADVVVAASHFTADAAALAAVVRSGALGVSYVYHLVAERSGLSARTLWSKSDERVGLALLRRFSDIVFASNRPTETALAQRGFAPIRTAVGVDLASFRQAAPAKLPPHAAFVGRMAHTKGVTDAVQAWARVRQAVPDAKLSMVGTGPERETGAALARQLGLEDSIEWLGFVSEEEKRRILGRSRLLLAPSHEEGWGISVCEAFASAVPVVAYRLPVLDELFGSAYVGATPGDIEGLADSAVRVLTDNAVAETLSRAGRETAERYDVGRVAEQELETILNRRMRCAS